MIAVTGMILAYGELWKFSPKSVAWYNWIQEVPVAGNVNVTGDSRRQPAPESENRTVTRDPARLETTRPRRRGAYSRRGTIRTSIRSPDQTDAPDSAALRL